MLEKTGKRRAAVVVGSLLTLVVYGCAAPMTVTTTPVPAAAVVHEPATVLPRDLSWGPIEVPGFPSGIQIAVIHGNPDESGPYTLRLRFPAGYRFPAHWHPMDENLTVISGTFLFAMGDRYNAASVRRYEPGAFLFAPARMSHYGGADGETVIQLHGMGPFAITVTDPYVPTGGN